MTTLIKGGNGFVPSVPLRIAVRGRGVDAMALLLTGQGLVRGDADVVFHGRTAHPSGAVRLTRDRAGTEWLEVALPAVEEGVARVLVVGSAEHGALRDATGLSVEAYAPDGTSVAHYEVTDAAGETAMVLAELYRRAGGWKFRAVGQGWASGLEGLATDHGVHVAGAPAPAAPAAAPQAPAPAPGPSAPAFAPPPPAPGPAAPVPGFAPPPAPAAPVAFAPPGAVPVPAPVPAPVPQQYPAGPGYGPPQPGHGAQAPARVAPLTPSQSDAWTYGPVFPPYTETGRDNDVITVEGLPPGPVVVQLEVPDAGYTGLWVLDRLNKKKDNLVNSTEDRYFGRVLATVPAGGTLRLRLEAEGQWRMEVSPLASARRLTEEEADFRGPDVLLHTGGVADLAIRYRGDDNLIVHVYELAGHEDSATLPRRKNVVNEIGKRRETVPLTEGPLVVEFEMADGPWRARLKRVQPHSGPANPWQGQGPSPAERRGWFPRR
ncbi:TerD family protein [Streptomyces filamentosus]|uniref:TerD domain-containing protein n=1 Tax=Streptomyces filamentosus TaxID=67294 RepID=A0A919BZC9_STRFL|nr:TerD family protein [Streptomyces filamentosus]GHG26699.1 hypothetical protein GCM10017667_74040 [Streptomyces filamentosus]